MGIKSELTNLIAADDIKKSIDKLLSYTESTGQEDLHSSVILLSSRYNRNEKMLNKAVLSNENYNMELNRITNSLKEYINSDLEELENTGTISDGFTDVENPNDQRKSVFISYSHSESEYAKKINASLKALDVEVVIDYENLSAGNDIKSFIEDSISQTSNTISIVSSNSLLSSWVSIEVIRTMFSENIANKKFIAAFIDDSFFERSFTGDALDKIELEIKDIHKEMDDRKSKDRNMDDLYSELKRYTDLKHYLPTIIQRLKESYSVDIRDEAYDVGIKSIHEALI